MAHGKPVYTADQIRRVARMYNTNADAASALRLSVGGFVRICRRMNVELPHERKRRIGSECSAI